MAEDPKNPDPGQAPVIPNAEPKEPQKPAIQEPPKGADQKPDEGQPKTVPEADYKALQGDYTRTKQEQKKMQQELQELREWRDKTQQAFGGPKVSDDSQSVDDLSAAELKKMATEHKAYGNETEAGIFFKLAKLQETIEKTSGRLASMDDMNGLYAEMSDEKSPIKPNQVDWKEIGQIQATRGISLRDARNAWVADHLNDIISPIVEKEKEAFTKAGHARSLDGDYDIQLSDAEKKAEEAEQAAIGDPRQWSKKT